MGAVRSVARRPVPAHPKLHHVQADLRDDSARRCLTGVDVLFHLGFRLWRDGPPAESEDANVGGTRNVVAAGPGRIVLASSAAVYGAWPDNPLPITEDQPVRPNRECDYARHKLAAERICTDSAPTAVLRICSVLGPHADVRVRRAARGYATAVPAMTGVPQALQFLHEDDVAAALHRCAAVPVTGVLNVASHDWLTEGEIALIGGGRVVRLPPKVLMAAAEAGFRLKLLGFGVDRAVLLCGPLALDPRRAEAELAWRPARSSAAVLADFLGSQRSRR